MEIVVLVFTTLCGIILFAAMWEFDIKKRLLLKKCYPFTEEVLLKNEMKNVLLKDLRMKIEILDYCYRRAYMREDLFESRRITENMLYARELYKKVCVGDSSVLVPLNRLYKGK